MLKKNQRDLAPLGRRNNVVPGLLEFARENPVEAGLLATSMAPVPVVSDVAGLLGDVTGMVKRPEDRTWANAGLAALGLLPFVPAGMGMLAGKGAKTADLVQLRKAEDLEKAGGNADDIWRETGWGRGTDGEWRFEIDDSGAGYNRQALPKQESETSRGIVEYGVGSLGQGVQHPPLYAAYPDVQGADLVAYDFVNPRGTFGLYREPRDSNFGLGNETITTWAGGNKSTTLHEIQHGIQHRENFARGAGSEEIRDAPNPKWQTWDENRDLATRGKALNDSPDYAAEMKANNEMWSAEFEPEHKALKAALDDPNVDIDEVFKKFDELFARAKREGAKRFPTMAEVDRISRVTPLDEPPMYMSPNEAYRASAGEVEARNVQHRMDWTPEQRRETPPWATEDVPRDQQIVRRGLLGDGPQMSADLPMDEASRMAQRNAAMPLENGGLGLPPDNTSEMRANALGYDVDAYHATNEAFDEFKPGWRGSTYLAQTPAGAHRGALFGDLDNLNPGSDLGHDRSRKITMPLKVRSKDIAGMSVREDIWRKLPDVIDDEDLIKDVADRVKAMGAKYWDDVYESVLQRDGSFRYYKKDIPEVNYQNMDGRDLFGGMLAGFNTGTDTKSLESAAKKGKSGFLVSDEAGTSIVAGPNMPIRSRFAKFDPKKINSRDLLAGVAGAGLLGVGARAAIPPEDERGLLY